MIYKNSDFTANINNSTVEVKKSNTNFYSEDKGTAQIRVYVNLNGKSLNLTDNGLTPQLDLFLADGMGPNFTNVTKALVDNAHAKGLVVHPWTVNTVADMDKAISYGVDGFFTNYPDLYKR